MVESAASYARLENITHIDFKRMSIYDALSEVTSAFSSQLASRNIDLDIRIDRSCTAKMNPMISAVFTNFISNAIKYGPSDSTIILETDDLNDMWKLKVIDFGSGIPDSDKELIFHRFKRLEQEHKSVKGFGLGLAIVKRIVELHEGDVGVEDNPYGQGSAFWFTLKKT